MTGDGGVSYRPLSFENYKNFYGGAPVFVTIKGMSFFLGDDLVAIAGVRYDGNFFTVFSDIKDGIIVPDITIWRATRVFMKTIDNMKCDVYATPDINMPNAARFLKRLGFRHVDGIYKRSCL